MGKGAKKAATPRVAASFYAAFVVAVNFGNVILIMAGAG